ncbi:MAG: hypothetical protein HC896_03805 [Bacteroidales bacterium]|nr:hypothetical protein [Bacteroidales bacterium]
MCATLIGQENNFVQPSDSCATGYIFNNEFCITVNEVPKLTAAPTIDGSAAEWANVPVMYEPVIQYGAAPEGNNTFPANPNDYKAKMKAAWDDDALYLLFEITDEDLQTTDVTSSSNYPWRKDGIEFATFLSPADSSRYPNYSVYPKNQWGISDDAATTEAAFNFFAPAWAAKHYIIPEMSPTEFREAGHNYFEWDSTKIY